MKKYSGLCLFLALVLMTVVAHAADDAQSLSGPEKFLIGTGIFNMEYHPDSDITRGEFAAMLSNALQLTNEEKLNNEKWISTVMGESDASIKPGHFSNIFDDVDESYAYYHEIEALYNKGIMIGISENKFAPEYGITRQEAQKVIISLLGYDSYALEKGGYPYGYSKTAASLGLINGISCAEDDVMTQKDAIYLFYNALDVKLLVRSSYSAEEKYEKSNETFMTGLLMMGKVKDIMIDNGYTAINGETKVGIGKIKVGTVTASLPASIGNATEYLGRKTEMYYTTNEFDESTAVYIELDRSDDAVSFDIKDFEKYENNKIYYYNGNRLCSKQLNSNAEAIVNNELCTVFDSSTFDFADGDVTLVNNDRGYKTIIVNKYEYAVVSGVDVDLMRIYNKMRGVGAAGVLDLSGSTVDEDAIILYNDKNERISLEDISYGDTLNIRSSANFLEIVKINNIVPDFKVKNFSVDDEESIYKSETQVYKASEVFETLTNKTVINTGSIYRLYLNKFGEIIWAEKAEDESGMIAVLLYAKKYELGETERYIKFYNQNNEMVRLSCDEKIKLNGKPVKFDDKCDLIDARKGELVIYKTNDDGTLSELLLPNEFGEDDGSPWYKIVPNKDSYGNDTEYYFEGQGKALETLFFAGDETIKFTVPEDEADYDDIKNFSVNKFSFTDNTYFTVNAYAKDTDDVIADAVVIKKEAGKGGTIKEGEAFLITSIKHTINEDDDPATLIKGYHFRIAQDAKYEEYYIADDAVIVDFGTNGIGDPVDPSKPIEKVGPRTVKELSPGDIIYFNVDISDEISTIRVAYDSDNKKAFNAGRGNDFYDEANAGTYASPTNTTWAGTVISRVDDGIRIATNYNPAAIDYKDFSQIKKHVVASQIRNPGSIILVDQTSGKTNVRTGAFEDIITYKDTGDVRSSSDIVVLAYWRSYNYGTIIYKK